MSTLLDFQGATHRYGTDDHGLICAFLFCPGQPPQALDSLAQVREQLGALQTEKGGERFVWLHLNLSHAGALAGLHGEQVARTRMVSLSVLFEGMLPRGMASRPTTLRA